LAPPNPGCAPPDPPPSNNFALSWYTLSFQAGDGTIFVAGASDEADCSDSNLQISRKLDPSLMTWHNVPASIPPGAVAGQSAVMYRSDEIIKAGRETGTSGPGREVRKIRLTDAEPAWTELPDMPSARNNFYLIALPDGNVLAIGGTAAVGGVVAGPDLYNPVSNTWTTMAISTQPRLYHSSALLLVDGSVWTSGGQHLPDGTPCDCGPLGSPCCDDQWTFQIFKPPYFFQGTRPVIASAPAEIRYNRTFVVESHQSEQVTKVRLLRLGSATHSFDADQRSLELKFTWAPTSPIPTLNIVAPLHQFLAPPGYYMLFIATGANGALPSEAKILRLDSQPL
jgi:hypothetical protein